MSRFLKALASVGLVELSEADQARIDRNKKGGAPSVTTTEDIEALLAQTRGVLEADAPAAPAGPPPPPEPPPLPIATEVQEGRALEQIYAQAGVPAAAFPAEKMLKVLEGLRAMPIEMRRAAVIAMDAADDAWSLDQVVADAQAKRSALEAAMAGLAATATAAEQRATAERADQDRALAEATARIREEIAALEALLQEEGVNVGAEKARILAHLTATREAVARETERLRADLARLDEVVRTFSP